MVGFALSCRALDISTSKGYDLVRDGKFPVPVEKIGGVWKVRTEHLIRFLRLDDPP